MDLLCPFNPVLLFEFQVDLLSVMYTQFIDALGSTYNNHMKQVNNLMLELHKYFNEMVLIKEYLILLSAVLCYSFITHGSNI